MGFSPGDFESRNEGKVHWEIKDGPRIVLWSPGELKAIISVDGVENINAMFRQLETLIMMMEES
jgi:hypothetical protein